MALGWPKFMLALGNVTDGFKKTCNHSNGGCAMCLCRLFSEVGANVSSASLYLQFHPTKHAFLIFMLVKMVNKLAISLVDISH